MIEVKTELPSENALRVIFDAIYDVISGADCLEETQN